MHDHPGVLDGRVHRHLEQVLRPARTRVVAALDVAAAHLTDPGGVEGQGEPISVDEALRLEYRPCAVGDAWGPAWGTTWLRLRGQVPAELRDAHLELDLDLGSGPETPGFQCEGLAYRADGSVIKGIHPRNRWIPVEPDASGAFEVYVEAAANPVVLGHPMFAETAVGTKAGAGPKPRYELRAADLVEVRDDVVALVEDLAALQEVARELPEDGERRWALRRAMDRALDQLDLRDVPGSAARVREALRPALETPAAEGTHRLHAVGHAHIDSAWLWPLRETRRKVARTIANQLDLAERHPEHRFAFPAAQHAAWLEEDHPALFERLRDAVAAGSIIPVGGMWVESDANLPGGEAMCRQFLQGQRFFLDRFGMRCEEVWLPDSFGYSAGLPQLARLAGARWFLTQKISWNQVNDFPHHSFTWEGLDGTRIFTHFPPADTYCSELDGRNLAHAARNFRDKGRSDVSLVPFGYGDGGGGPTREMLERARRVGDLLGAPKLELSTPKAFFTDAEASHEDPSVWRGELYLELHRGTFTSVAEVKRGNRECEHLLREAELWSATAAVRGLAEYPLERLGELWREVLLYQFHDILPGTCIAWVYEEVLARQARILEELEGIVDEAQAALAGDGEGVVGFNASPLTRDGVPALGAGPVAPPEGEVRVADGVLDNGFLRVTVTAEGITSMVDLVAGREALPPGAVGAALRLHPDFPNAWDAWDIDEHALHTHEALVADAVEEVDGGVELTYRFHVSTARTRLTLAPGDPRLHIEVHVDWAERDSLLKLAFPLDVQADEAACEVQMGHLRRPIHTNTSWEAARFEVHAHRWVHVGEPDWGVAIANARTYGWSFERPVRAGGGTSTTVLASLLKGPRFPDPSADLGEHTFRFTLRPGAGIQDAIADGYDANLRVRELPGAVVEPIIAVERMLIEALKLAEDGSGDVVVRLREPLGARAETVLTAGFAADAVWETDLIEEPLTDGGPGVAPSVVVGVEGSEVRLRFRPFQVATLRFRRG